MTSKQDESFDYLGVDHKSGDTEKAEQEPSDAQPTIEQLLAENAALRKTVKEQRKKIVWLEDRNLEYRLATPGDL